MSQAQTVLNLCNDIRGPFDMMTEAMIDTALETHSPASAHSPDARTTEYTFWDYSRLIVRRANAAHFDLRALPAKK